MKKVFLSFLAIFATVLLLASCVVSTAPKVSSITLDTTSVKVEYQIGESFSKEGLKVTAIYSDDSKVEVALDDVTINASAYKANMAGTYQIVVSYKGVSESYNVKVVEPTPNSLIVDASASPLKFMVGDEFSYEGLVLTVVLSNGETGAWTGEYTVDSSKFNSEVVGSYEITVSALVNGLTVSGTYTVEVMGLDAEINSVEDFLAMREFSTGEGVNPRNYVLNVDLDLTGVELSQSTVTFTGTLDGQGHTIKNATYVQKSSKEGLIFKLVEGATIKNLNFFACTVIGGASESVAIIAGECNNVGVTFQNIEFSCCTVNGGAQNYAALLFARNEKNAINVVMEGITVKNLTNVTSKQYAGGLIGDMLKGSTVTAKDCDIDVTINSSNNISVFTGRNRGADVTVENAVVRLDLADGTSASSVGIFSDGNASSLVKAKNVIVLACAANGKDTDLLAGQTKNVNSANVYENVHVVSEDVLISTSASVTSVAKANVTSAYVIETVLKNAEAWEADSNKVVKLKVASANTPSEGATVKELKLIVDAVDVQYFVGESFSSAGLIVTAIYSDGCVIALTEYDLVIEDQNGNEVADFSKAEFGTYNVVISSGSVEASFEINLVQEVGITINHEWVKKVYTVGQELDLTDLVVFAEISDGTHTLLDAKGYNVKVDALSAEGTYVVTICREGFEQTFEIEVVAPVTELTPIVNVHVGAALENGSLNAEGELQFATLAGALDYLESANLPAETVKNIYLAAGNYQEKVTVSIPNVTLIGGTELYKDTVIVYDTASGSSTPDEKSTYGTDNSAVVIIKSTAHNFTARNIYFVNSFDYNGSTLANKQALAVRCDADQSLFVNCGFSGNQDTLEAKMGRQYYYNCYIEGNVDFIFGNNAAAVFESCTINAVTRYNKGEPEDNNGYVCAPKGYSTGSGTDTVAYNFVFLNCAFTADEDVLPGSMSIARPWGADAGVATINCSFTEAYAVAGYDGSVKSRYFDMSGTKPTEETVKFVEYNNTGAGSVEEAVAGMKLLTAEEAAMYTLANIFAATNGQVTYELGAWYVAANPTETLDTKYVVSYTAEKVEYKQNEAWIATVKAGYVLTGNSVAGYTASVAELVEAIYNAEGNEVDAADVTKVAGTYTAKLYVGQVEVGVIEITVVEGEAPEVIEKSITLNASSLEKGKVDAGTTYQGIFSVYGKSGAQVEISEFTATDGTTDYTKTIKLSGGKGAYSDGVFTNGVKVVIEKDGKIVVVASQKNVAGTRDDVNLVLFSETGEKLQTTEKSLGGYDVTLEIMTFEVEAGTYYIGALNNGFYLYAISYVYEEVAEQEPVVEYETVELNASELEKGKVDSGTTYKEIYSVYGKDSSATMTQVEIASFEGSDGTNSYSKTIKLSGGKTGFNATVPANCLKVVATKAGTITVVASQKNDTANVRTDVNLVLFGADGTKIATSTEVLSANDGTLSVITFEITEAGTYYIGSSNNGCFVFAVSYTYVK